MAEGDTTIYLGRNIRIVQGSDGVIWIEPDITEQADETKGVEKLRVSVERTVQGLFFQSTRTRDSETTRGTQWRLPI